MKTYKSIYLFIIYLLFVFSCNKTFDSEINRKKPLIGSWNLKKNVDNQYFEIHISNDYIYTLQEEVISSITKYKIRNDSIIYIYDEDSISNYGTRFKMHHLNSFSTYSKTRESIFERTVGDAKSGDFINNSNLKKQYWKAFEKRKNSIKDN